MRACGAHASVCFNAARFSSLQQHNLQQDKLGWIAHPCIENAVFFAWGKFGGVKITS
eukprot:m.32030 g.32030  ORF g.32030 m.32030 type:complete len:57 (+) comp14885_c0_seq2:71-241(+)